MNCSKELLALKYKGVAQRGGAKVLPLPIIKIYSNRAVNYSNRTVICSNKYLDTFQSFFGNFQRLIFKAFLGVMLPDPLDSACFR